MKWWPFNKQEKLNPAQEEIVYDSGEQHDPSNEIVNHRRAYNTLEVVNRGVNLVVDSAAEIGIDVGDKIHPGIVQSFRPKKLDILINFKPNMFINADTFKRNIYIDLILEGNAFIYFDGAYLYNIPAFNMEIISDKKKFIKEYKYGETTFLPEEIIHIRDNAGDSIFRGKSRLESAKTSIAILNNMNSYQENFFKNSAIPGLVLKTPNVLSNKVKERIVAEWQMKYNPKNGGRRPVVLDGDFQIDTLSKYTFSDLDFAEGILTQEKKILKAIGVPPLLLDAGNNANINPNLRLFYINTVLPVVNKVITSLEFYFGYDLKPVTQNVLALRPELRDLGNYLSAITNAGIITRNEAREDIRKPAHTADFADDLILPANVAGSAVNPGTGGKPPNDGEE